jgi:nicotinate-nucleotide pyrophosphorylase (carboxylating)
VRKGLEPLDYKFIDKIKDFLNEDIGYGDITSDTLIPSMQLAKGILYYKEPGIVSGLNEVSIVFETLGCKVNRNVVEGEWTEARNILLTVEGSARALLMGERLALNIAGRMAGIATQTAYLVNELSKKNLTTRVAATRKTLPGFRDFDKKAVIHGGGDPHRFRLDDCVLIKDNHLELVPSITDALRCVRAGISFTKKIEVEVRSLEEAVEAAKAGADIIMFDNMTPDDIRLNLDELNKLRLREGIVYEASGGITPENFIEYAESGVDIISLGALTHSVRSLDVKFEIEMIK